MSATNNNFNPFPTAQHIPDQQPEPEFREVGDEKIAIQTQLPKYCPECGYEYYIEKKDIRYVFKHSRAACSRSRTKFSRPIAQFTVFI